MDINSQGAIMATVTDGVIPEDPNYIIVGDYATVHIFKIYNECDGQGFTWMAFDVKDPEYVIEMNDDLETVIDYAKEYADGCLQDPEIGDGMTDAEADADVLRSAGWGTDEDYGG